MILFRLFFFFIVYRSFSLKVRRLKFCHEQNVLKNDFTFSIENLVELDFEDIHRRCNAISRTKLDHTDSH